MKNSFKHLKATTTCNEFGNTARDNVMQFQIDNETGYNFVADIDGTNVTLKLFSKTGKQLGDGGTFSLIGNEGIEKISVDAINKRLDFELKNGEHKYCDISSIYSLINSKSVVTSSSINGDVKVNNDDVSVYKSSEDSDLTVKFSDIISRLEKLEYKPIEITSFSVSDSIVQMGNILTSTTFTWNYNVNKTPKSLRIDDTSIDTSLKTKTIDGLSISSNKKYTITSIDEYDNQSSKTCTTTFLNKVYWGVSDKSEVSDIDSNFIKSLSGELSSTFVTGKSITAGSTQYIYYALPHRMGIPTFTLDPSPFPGGMGDTYFAQINFVNEYNYTETYDVWRSDNPGLESITLIVK